MFTTLLAGSVAPLIIVLVLLVIIIAILISCIRIVPQATAQVIERLGSYKTTWTTGMHFKLPFIESVSKKISLISAFF